MMIPRHAHASPRRAAEEPGRSAFFAPRARRATPETEAYNRNPIGPRVLLGFLLVGSISGVLSMPALLNQNEPSGPDLAVPPPQAVVQQWYPSESDYLRLDRESASHAPTPEPTTTKVQIPVGGAFVGSKRPVTAVDADGKTIELKTGEVKLDKVSNSDLLSWPVASHSVTSHFGPRIDPIYGTSLFHTGTDFGGACGSQASAAADGVVEFAGVSGMAGNRVVVRHSDSLATTYNHMTSISVSVGQKVKRGQQVGTVGTTGHSTGCHMHFEVRYNGFYVNPMPWLTGSGSRTETGVKAWNDSYAPVVTGDSSSSSASAPKPSAAKTTPVKAPAPKKTTVAKAAPAPATTTKAAPVPKKTTPAPVTVTTSAPAPKPTSAAPVPVTTSTPAPAPATTTMVSSPSVAQTSAAAATSATQSVTSSQSATQSATTTTQSATSSTASASTPA